MHARVPCIRDQEHVAGLYFAASEQLGQMGDLRALEDVGGRKIEKGSLGGCLRGHVTISRDHARFYAPILSSMSQLPRKVFTPLVGVALLVPLNGQQPDVHLSTS